MNKILNFIRVIYLMKFKHTPGGVEATLGTVSIVISSLSRGLGMGVDVAEGPWALGNLAAILCLACGWAGTSISRSGMSFWGGSSGAASSCYNGIQRRWTNDLCLYCI